MKHLISISLIAVAWMVLAPHGSELPAPLQAILPPAAESDATMSPLLAAGIVWLALLFSGWIATRFTNISNFFISERKVPRLHEGAEALNHGRGNAH